MSGYLTPEAVFTVGACAAWGFALWWAFRQPKYRWYHVWVLGLLTLFWWLGESIAIRLGKYQYPKLGMRIPFPGGGTPDHLGPVFAWLFGLVRPDEPPPSSLMRECLAKSWDIPFSVIALEAALLFGLFRLSVTMLKSESGSRLRAALATAGMSGFLMVNVTAILDPVVSTTQWCEPSMPDPGYHYLTFGLWQWYTTDAHPGFWYGVPLVNYAAWFLAAATFSFVARLDDERPSGVLRRYKLASMYLLATVGITALMFIILLPVKMLVDKIMVHGQDYLFSPHPIFSPKMWEFTTTVALLGVGLYLIRRGRREERPRFDWISAMPKLLVFLFCLGLLRIQFHGGLFRIWIATAAIATAVLLWPFIIRAIRQFRSRRGGRSNQPTPEETVTMRSAGIT